MKKEDRVETIHDALDYLDDDLIEDVDKLRRNEVETSVASFKSKTKNKSWRKWTTLAASICILVAGSLIMGDYLESTEPNGDYVPGTEAESEKDNVDKEEEIASGNLSDVTTENETGSVNSFSTEQIRDEVGGNPEMMETETEPSDEDNLDVEGTDTNVTLGDLYQLKDNYIRVSMIPHKVWETAKDEKEAYEQAVTIDEKYQDDFAIFVDTLCKSGCIQIEESLQQTPNTEDLIYHLFFEKKDGEVVHCWLLGKDRVFYHEKDDLCIVIENKELYNNIYNILAMHW